MNAGFSGSDEKRLSSGSHRTCSVQETLARILPIKHRFGISRVANVTGLDHIGLPVVIAVRPNARSIAISQGKGRTLDHAKASAVMEAIEIWHAEHIDLPVFFASVADLLARHKFVDLDQLPITRERIPKHTERLHWVKSVELNSGQEMLVPLEMVHADYTHPLPPGVGCFPSSTNGLASGNHILEAICHGICEVIERDALSVWHHASLETQKATRLALGSIDDALVEGVLQDFRNVGLECGVWDVTSDIGVATFLCIVREPGAESDHLGLGSGTHPDRAIALQRALNEAAQTRPGMPRRLLVTKHVQHVRNEDAEQHNRTDAMQESHAVKPTKYSGGQLCPGHIRELQCHSCQRQREEAEHHDDMHGALEAVKAAVEFLVLVASQRLMRLPLVAAQE